jgi:hypothetical protein
LSIGELDREPVGHHAAPQPRCADLLDRQHLFVRCRATSADISSSEKARPSGCSAQTVGPYPCAIVSPAELRTRSSPSGKSQRSPWIQSAQPVVQLRVISRPR